MLGKVDSGFKLIMGRICPSPEAKQRFADIYDYLMEGKSYAEIGKKFNNVRVIEPGQRLGLPLKPFCELGIATFLGSEELEGNQAVELRLPGLVDHPHATATEAFQEFQLREVFGNLAGRRAKGRFDDLLVAFGAASLAGS